MTREEVREEFEFLDACLDTRVMRTLIDFLCRKGLLKTDDPQYFRRILHRMWFALYPRAYRAMGSCAFEHVFLGEVKDGKVQGFHNWLFFLLEEQRGDVNYYGFSKGFSFGRNRGGIIKTIFEWEGKVKPVGTVYLFSSGTAPKVDTVVETRISITIACNVTSIYLKVSSVFIGLSPELELALYTLCVLLCPGKPVNITLGGKTLEIQTHLFHKRGKKYLSTAFPEI